MSASQQPPGTPEPELAVNGHRGQAGPRADAAVRPRPYVSDDGRVWWDHDPTGWRPVAALPAPPAQPPTSSGPAGDRGAAGRHPADRLLPPAPGLPSDPHAGTRPALGHPAPESLPEDQGPDAPPAPRADPGEFAAERFLPAPPAIPRRGLRAAVYRVSGGAWNPGQSPRERRESVLYAQARTPIRGDVLKVAVAASKGGVGKTTTCLGLGMALGSVRNDRVVALEANSSMGTFGVRVRTEHQLGMAHLLAGIEGIDSYADLRRFTSHVPQNRLEVLTNPLDATRSDAFAEADLRRVLALLSRYQDLILEDMGIDLLHSATGYLLRTCDFALVVSPDSYDGGKLANDLLDWLATRRSPEWLESRALVVINGVRKDTMLEVDAMAAHFARRARGCLRVRFDRHLDSGGILDWDQLTEGTRLDYLELAASLATGFELGPDPEVLRC